MKKLFLNLFLFPALAFAANPPIRPDASLTPGVVNPDATVDVICVPNYTAGVDAKGNKVRNVPESLKKKAFAAYNIDPTTDKFEIDHLINLELGGANDLKNLWPQSYTTQPWNAHKKDALENKLHKLVCQKKLDLAVAQQEISKDWIAAYNKYVSQ